MSSSNILAAFNNHLLELFYDVLTIFPEDVEINAAIITLKQMKKTNPKLLIIGWNEYIVKPYNQEIEQGNINFLIEKDYNIDLNEYDTNGIIRTKIETLRTPVKNMSINNKNKVVKYIQNLTKLSNKYIY
jgi:hypothetical protein